MGDQQHPNAGDVDPLTLCYCDRVWLQQFPLNANTVLDYFANSQFYDRTCSNEVIKMQRLDPSNLRNMTGIEYVVHHGQEPGVLYIILKQRRESYNKTVPIELYYVIEGTIYKCPDLAALANSRFSMAMYYMNEAFETVKRHQTFCPTKGCRWIHNSADEEEEGNQETMGDEGCESPPRMGDGLGEEGESTAMGKDSLSGEEFGLQGAAKTDRQDLELQAQYLTVDRILRSLFAQFPLPEGEESPRRPENGAGGGDLGNGAGSGDWKGSGPSATSPADAVDLTL